MGRIRTGLQAAVEPARFMGIGGDPVRRKRQPPGVRGGKNVHHFSGTAARR